MVTIGNVQKRSSIHIIGVPWKASLLLMEQKKYLKQYFNTKSTHEIKDWKLEKKKKDLKVLPGKIALECIRI